MEKFSKIVLISIFTALIVGSIQNALAEDITDMFKPVPIKNAEYQFHLQAVLRDTDGRLITVTESTNGYYIPHAVTDEAFDIHFGKKEISTIDNIKYEKVQWKFNPSLEHRFVGLYPIYSELSIELVSEYGDDTAKMYESEKDFSHWKIHYCGTFEGHGITCIPVFQVLVPTMTLEPTDTVEQQWTILREIE